MKFTITGAGRLIVDIDQLVRSPEFQAQLAAAHRIVTKGADMKKGKKPPKPGKC